MRLGDRIEALSDTIQQTSEWATKLDQDGISLRFLNDFPKSETIKLDGLVHADQIEDVVIKVQFRGDTQLGTALRTKVVQPLIDKAVETDGRVKARIVIIITDGKVR
jgi:hypothetical protein